MTDIKEERGVEGKMHSHGSSGRGGRVCSGCCVQLNSTESLLIMQYFDTFSSSCWTIWRSPITVGQTLKRKGRQKCNVMMRTNESMSTIHGRIVRNHEFTSIINWSLPPKHKRAQCVDRMQVNVTVTCNVHPPNKTKNNYLPLYFCCSKQICKFPVKHKICKH